MSRRGDLQGDWPLTGGRKIPLIYSPWCPRLLSHVPDDCELRVSLQLSVAGLWIVRIGSLPSSSARLAVVRHQVAATASGFNFSNASSMGKF